MTEKQTNAACAMCNKPIYCNTENISNCACGAISLTPETKSYLTENFTSCLCNVCLGSIQNKVAKPLFKVVAFFALFFLTNLFLQAQFAPSVGIIGTTAMYKDSSAFKAWANTCVVTRGYQDITNQSIGYVSVGNDSAALGQAGLNGVVSLGDAGYAVLTFAQPITNGVGFDFAVFENSFSDDFLELAFVEVSSDGIHFFRFPATSNTQTITQIGTFEFINATNINNLAGKYRANYGTPFDLQELSAQAGLDINAITHVKIVDVVGSINSAFTSFDINNNPVNDPFPTAFASGGFDLDAVGVINQLPVGIKDNTLASHFIKVYPNPADDNITIIANDFKIKEMYLIDVNGKLLLQSKQTNLSLNNVSAGFYFLKVVFDNNQTVTQKIIKK